ncbi:YybH family protein [Kordiimonas sp.]|uniref:YybH family protein n=1 Tax=Kordiimonas sp. TaxID=1970157 RepID=UPI003B52B932
MACPIGVQAADDSEDRAAIEAQAAAFSRAYVSGETDTLMAIYAPDASIVPTNRPILKGEEKIRQYWTPRDGAKWHPVRHEITSEELTVHGDVATDIGYFEGASANDDGEERAFRGAYLITWRKIAGVWRIQHDIWNSLKVPAGD